MDSNIESTDEIKNGKVEIENEVNLNHAGQNCALCGCSTPAVRCDKCSSQIFCLSCDDMYHRHPKRRLHLRKAVDSIWNSHRSPRLRRHTNLPGDPSKIPIPPPRRKRRERYTISGAGLPKSAFEIPAFSTREPWLTRGQNIKSHDAVSDSFASDDGLPPLPKQQRSSVEQKYENSEAILQQNNGMDSKAGRTDGEVVEQVMSEEQRQHDSMQSPSSPSQPLQVDMPDGRTFGPAGQMYSRGSQMSHSAAELRSAYFPSSSPQPFFYPQPHPHFIHPHMHSFPHAVPHMNCPQCLTGSWSNMMSPHMPPFQPWSSAQSTLSRRQQETAGESNLRQRQNSLPEAAAYPGPHIPFPPAAFPYVGSPFYPQGYPGAESPLFMDSPRSADQQRQTMKSPSSTSSRQSQGTEKREEDQAPVQKILGADEEGEGGGEKEEGEEEGGEKEEEEEEEEVADPDTADVDYKPPEKPAEPWSCAHCTYINPPGSHICEICCKTSYPSPVKETVKEKKKKKKKSEHDSPVSPGPSQKMTDTEESMQVDSEQPVAVDSEKVI